MFQCEKCDKIFCSKQKLQLHIKACVYDLYYVCPKHREAFRHRESYMKHHKTCGEPKEKTGEEIKRDSTIQMSRRGPTRGTQKSTQEPKSKRRVMDKTDPKKYFQAIADQDVEIIEERYF